MIARFENGTVKFFTRNGREKKGFVNIKNELMKQYKNLEGYVLDGEAISKGNWNDTASAIQSSVNFDEEKDKSIVYNIFDILTIEEFDNNECLHNLKDRRGLLLKTVQQTDVVKITEAWSLHGTQEEVIHYLHSKFEELRSLGFEGLMIKDLKSTYNYKRDRSWLKYKGENTGDFLCVEVLEGKGKLKGTLGKIKVLLKDDLYCDVSGFTDEERDYYWKNPDTIVGYVVEIKYTERTKTDSLRNPRFVKVRYDKNSDQVDQID
jgi:DNA ligase-1